MGYNTKKFSKAQEKRVAQAVGGKIQVASGAIQSASLKADVGKKDDTWSTLIECKTKAPKGAMQTCKSFSIKKEWLSIVQQQAFEGKYSMGILAFSMDNKKDYYVLDSFDFTNMLQSLRDYEKVIDDQKQRISDLEQTCLNLVKQIEEDI